MSKCQYDVIAVGEVLVDLISDKIVPALDQAEGFQRFPGGEVTNVAWNVSVLGGRAALVACVGDDGFGNYLRRELESVGICTKCLRVTPRAPTTVAVNARQTETPDFIIYRGADAHIPLEDGYLEAIKASRIVHTSAFALSREPARTTIFQLLELAQQSDCLISLDPNYHPRIWPDVSDIYEVLREAYQWVRITKPSLDDCERLFGPGPSPIAYAERFLDLGAEIVSLTMGARGVLLVTADGELSQIRTSDVSVTDVTGAGDAFWAGLLTALLDGYSLEEAACFGQLVAEIKISTTGPVLQMPDKDSLYDRLGAITDELLSQPPTEWRGGE